MRDWNPQFTTNFHMEQEQFDGLFDRIRHRLEPKRHTRADAIGAKQRLAYTLE